MSKIKMASYGYPIINKLMNFLPNNYLEIGIFSGEGIKEIAINNKNKIFYAIDPFIEDGYTIADSQVSLNEKMISQREITLDNISKISNIILYELKSKEFINAVLMILNWH